MILAHIENKSTHWKQIQAGAVHIVIIEIEIYK